MTIAVIWQEDDLLWCAADTRVVAGPDDKPTTEIGSKIYAIPVAVSSFGTDGFVRQPHFWTQYGFVYAGAVLPALQTAVMASTLLQKLARPGGRANPPKFEHLAELVRRLAKRFMEERHRFRAEGLFSAAFFGWCPYANKYKIAHISGKVDGAGFRVELFYPDPPKIPGQPWVMLGNGIPAYNSTFLAFQQSEKHITKRVPCRVIEKMVSEAPDKEAPDKTVGGSTSIGVASPKGFELCFTCEPIVSGQSAVRRILGGLDMDIEIGQVGDYLVATGGVA